MSKSKYAVVTCSECSPARAFPAAEVSCSLCWNTTTMCMQMCERCSQDSGRCLICGTQVVLSSNRVRAYNGARAVVARQLGREANAVWHARSEEIGAKFAEVLKPATEEFERRIEASRLAYARAAAPFHAEYRAACDKFHAIRVNGGYPTEEDRRQWLRSNNRVEAGCRPFSKKLERDRERIVEWYHEQKQKAEVARDAELSAAYLEREWQIVEAEFEYRLAFAPWWRRLQILISRWF